jgi:hypothetical protein
MVILKTIRLPKSRLNQGDDRDILTFDMRSKVSYRPAMRRKSRINNRTVKAIPCGDGEIGTPIRI